MLVLFHNIEFLAFFVPVLLLYWGAPHRYRNGLLLVASYVFYGSWNWKFLGCILASTALDYLCGLAIHRSENPRKRKLLLTLSVVVNLGMLGFFKYYNFFIESAVALADSFGVVLSAPTLDILLPIGISFYTFQTMSYSIDIFRKKIEPTTNVVDFALFVVFFPQLIAGPIEKARNLLPQLQLRKHLSEVDWRKGIYLYLYGCFLKLAIADPVGHMVNQAFGAPDGSLIRLDTGGSRVLLALYGYALQIYCDFSGYSKMARGLACMLGVRLSRNFYMPFFARGYLDFYKRWHITLSEWIGEYVYMPLYYAIPRMRWFRGIESTATRLYISAALALLVTRIAFGLWHGASMTFVCLGMFIYFGQLLSAYAHQATKHTALRNNPVQAAIARPLQSLFMIHMFAFAMLFFRSHGLEQVGTFASHLFTDVNVAELFRFDMIWCLYLPALFIYAYELLQYRADDEFLILRQSGYRKLAFSLTLVILWTLTNTPEGDLFIYFQF